MPIAILKLIGWRGGIAIALLLALAFQTARIEGFPIFGGGFKATIAAKNTALKRAASDLRMAELNLSACSGAVGRQNAAVSALEAAGVESTRRAASALREAAAANSRADEAIERMRVRPVKDCETGEAILSGGL